jgi:hypothetical protein
MQDAYVRDELTTDELGARVGIAHLAETLDELTRRSGTCPFPDSAFVS